MVPSLAYVGMHERETIDPVGITHRFIDLLAECGDDGLPFDREQFSQLPNQAGMIAKPFSVETSKLLKMNDPAVDVMLED